MTKDLNLQIQETDQIPNKINPPQKSIPRYIIVKLLKTKDKILKASREKWHLPYNGKTIWMTSDFSLEALEIRKSGIIFPFLFGTAFLRAKRKELSTQNSTSSENREWRGHGHSQMKKNNDNLSTADLPLKSSYRKFPKEKLND